MTECYTDEKEMILLLEIEESEVESLNLETVLKLDLPIKEVPEIIQAYVKFPSCHGRSTWESRSAHTSTFDGPDFIPGPCPRCPARHE